TLKFPNQLPGSSISSPPPPLALIEDASVMPIATIPVSLSTMAPPKIEFDGVPTGLDPNSLTERTLPNSISPVPWMVSVMPPPETGLAKKPSVAKTSGSGDPISGKPTSVKKVESSLPDVHGYAVIVADRENAE